MQTDASFHSYKLLYCLCYKYNERGKKEEHEKKKVLLGQDISFCIIIGFHYESALLIFVLFIMQTDIVSD